MKKPIAYCVVLTASHGHTLSRKVSESSHSRINRVDQGLLAINMFIRLHAVDCNYGKSCCGSCGFYKFSSINILALCRFKISNVKHWLINFLRDNLALDKMPGYFPLGYFAELHSQASR